jgi:hypothetical protein
VARVEIGVQDRQVVLMITVPSGDGEAYLTRVPLAPDEAREVVNGIGEAVKFLCEGETR